MAGKQKLGDLLLKANLVLEEELDKALALQGDKKDLEEKLLEENILSEQELTNVLSTHKKASMKLGEYLVTEGIVGDDSMVDLLSKQMGINKYSPDIHSLDMTLSDLFPVDVAQKYHSVPLCKIGSVIVVAMTDPTNIDALDAIEELVGTEMEVVICTERELNHLISNLYGQYAGLGDVLQRMEQMPSDTTEETESDADTEYIDVSSREDESEEGPIVRFVNSLLNQAIRTGVSDIHISPEKDSVQLRFRIDGKLHEAPAPPKAMFQSIISRLKVMSSMDISVSRNAQDGRFTVKSGNKEVNFRVSTIPTIYGENMVLRILDKSGGLLSIDELGITENDKKKIKSTMVKPYGMILSTGPTGSGKTTTLYSILKQINQPDINIITLEDPVEFRVNNIRQVQLNRKAGMTFASGMRSLVRQDPDVIMLGEIRDAETTGISIQAAMTGHRVLSTLHTNDAAGAITRLLDLEAEPFIVASVLLISIAQRLVRKICTVCKESYTPSSQALTLWGFKDVKGAKFSSGNGCSNCMGTGYKGRTGIYEVLTIDEMIQEMIMQRKSSREITLAARKTGRLKTLKDNAARKVLMGITSPEEAASAVML